ncbi:MAG: LuxR C-terminal-related transcriptional regulator [Chloroflexota bacterium]|nr:LuxR C-terminal-related transcriptional regulator [Chloroflexota bacterium]
MNAQRQILATKLYMPRPTTALVMRPRLLDQLDMALSRPLTAVIASPGSGKTTLVSTWAVSKAADKAASVAWLTLDAHDDDPARFWTAVITALQTIDPLFGQELLPLVSSITPSSSEYILAPLINQLAEYASTPIVLVLDDYHEINLPAIHTGVSFVIDHLPPYVHVVLTSRSDPPLSLPRLRARGQMLELRAADLRFTEEEAASYLNDVMGLELEADSVAALDARTEGWIAGLHLAALSMQHQVDREGFVRSLSGNHHFIQDYLIEEVLQRQAVPVRDFLLQTAILNRLCAPLCDAVTGGSDAGAMLEWMKRANLFLISLDDERRWYRYHPLFADTLRARLAQEQGTHIPELHARASDWFGANAGGDTTLLGEAIRHALSAGAGERAAHLVESAAESVSARNEHVTLLAWLAALPQNVLQAHPRLAILSAQLHIATGSLDDVPRLLDLAAAALEQSTLVPEDQAALTGGISAVQVHLLQLDEQFEQATALAKHALEVLPANQRASRALAALGLALADHMRGALAVADDVYRDAIVLCQAVGDDFFEITTRCLHGILLQERGELSAADAAFQTALQRATLPAGRLPVAGWALIGLGSVAYARYDLDRAEWLLAEGLDLARRGAVRDALFHGSANLTLLRLGRGDLEGARATAEQFVRDAQACGIGHFMRWAEALHARVDLAAGDLVAATRWARLARPRADALVYSDKAAFATLIRILIATGEVDAARRCITAQRALVAPFSHICTQVELYVLDTLALLHKGNDSAARVALDSALAIAAPRGLIQVFVEMGDPLATLLAQRSQHGPLGAFAARLLSAFGHATSEAEPAPIPRVFDDEADVYDPLPTNEAWNSASSVALAEPLSEREQEVLLLMARGMSNQEIADHLVISVPTVKKHGSNIFGKLHAANRTEAVARARDLGLLPPTLMM